MGVIGLAHNLNLKVVAEGVETEEQLRCLDLWKCDEWQGFLASRAVTADAANRLLAGVRALSPLIFPAACEDSTQCFPIDIKDPRGGELVAAGML